MLKLSLKSVAANKVRLTLTALAIVLGVMFVAGSYVFTDSLKSAFDVLFEQEGATVDLVVRAETDFQFATELGTVPDTLLAEVEAIDGVQTAVPIISGFAQLVDQEGNPIGGVGPPTLAFSWDENFDDVSALTLRSGRGPEGPGEIGIDAFTADAKGFVVGDQIDVITPLGVETFEIVGILGFGDADNLLGATLAVFELPTAQRILDLEGKYNQISIMTADGADIPTVQAEIAAFLDEGLEVVLGEVEIEEGREQVDQGVGGFNTALLVFAMIAVFVGGFIIQNTYRVIVSQRTKELAMLRAVGATGAQVTRMVFFEALIVGIIASAIGVGAGILLALGLKSLFSAIGFGFPSGPLTVLPRTIIIGMVVGVGITLASAILPARKAARVAPLAAMRDTESTYFKSLRKRLYIGLGVLVIGAAMLLIGLFTEIDQALLLVGLGAGVVFLAVAILAPLMARRFGQIVGAPLPRMLGITGRLARDNAVRKPRRMAATASALMIGVALVAVIATMAASLKASITEAVGSEVSADYQIETGGFADPTMSGISVQLADDLRALDEVSVVSVVRYGAYRDPVGQTESFLAAFDPEVDQTVRLELEAGDFGRMGPGTVMLHSDVEGFGIGDPYPIEFPNGVITDLEVVAIFGASLFQIDVVISMEMYEENFDNRFAAMMLVNVAAGSDPVAVRPALEAVVGEYPNAEMSDKEEYVDKVGAQIDALLNVVTALLAMAILIALLGITNTMALSIIERRREIGLLRAVGMTRRQVKRMIRWEAVLIGIFGAVLGLVVGVVLGAAVVVAIGEGIKLTLPWGQLLFYLVAAALGGVLASLLPARRGAKTDILEAISFE
ncbi:FtsX-like permease family protein [bacterium]|nr:FtsX-like permease family protein [bacterium]